jgi:hypothetical protein
MNGLVSLQDSSIVGPILTDFHPGSFQIYAIKQ